jgi:hypothetical protein
MRPLLALPLLLLATSALAGWESGMVEDEGGPTMMAWVEGEGGDVPPELRMMCGDQVNLRYGMGSGPGEGVAPGGEPLPFTFDFGDATITLDMQYEEMDGAHAAYFAVDAPILGLLRSHGSAPSTIRRGPGARRNSRSPVRALRLPPCSPPAAESLLTLTQREGLSPVRR